MLKNDLLLHEAVIKNDPEAVRKILKEPVDVNCRNNVSRCARCRWGRQFRGQEIGMAVLPSAAMASRPPARGLALRLRARRRSLWWPAVEPRQIEGLALGANDGRSPTGCRGLGSWQRAQPRDALQLAGPGRALRPGPERRRRKRLTGEFSRRHLEPMRHLGPPHCGAGGAGRARRAIEEIIAFGTGITRPGFN